jgi:hypothetical protein
MSNFYVWMVINLSHMAIIWKWETKVRDLQTWIFFLDIFVNPTKHDSTIDSQ